MKERIKKTFAFFILPIVFSSSFPFVKLRSKQKEDNPDTIQVQYPINQNRNIFISAINNTASRVTNFFKEITKI